MIQGCGRRCCPGCRPSMRAAWWSAKPATGTPTGGSVFPVYRLEVPSPPMRAPERGGARPPPPPPAAPNSSDKGKGAAGSSSSPGATGRSEGERRHRLRRTDGSFVSDPPLDSDPPRSVRGWLARPWRPAPRPRARRGASVLLLHHHQTTATATIIRFAAATPRAAVAGTVNVPLSGSLEGPGPQVSVPLFYFFTGLVIISTGINPSSAYQGLLPLCSQSRSHW
jgi:hypothetical protein